MKNVKDIINYIIFGILTTVINWGIYFLCYDILKIANVTSTIFAWIISVGFAFITNKLWVFNSKSLKFNVLLRELYKFVAARLLTGILDVIIMYVTVDVYSMNANIWKLIANIIVIAINYLLSKFLIFAKK